MKIKIIFIISFPPAYHHLEKGSDGGAAVKFYNKKVEFIGIYEKDWGHVIGNRIMKMTDKFDYTVLRPDYRADKVYEYEFKTGLKHIIFPGKYLSKLVGIKLKKSFYSDELFNYLDELLINREKIVLLIPIDKELIVKNVMKKYYKKFPIINLHFSTNTTLLPAVNFSLNPLKIVHRIFLKVQMVRLLKRMTNITLGHKSNKSQIEKIYNIKTIIYSAGFDPDEWNYKINRENARDKLGVNCNTKVILISSRLTPEKQIDKVINVLSRFRNNDFVCFISGRGTEEYKKYLCNLITKCNLSEKVKITGFLSQEDLAHHYIASDIFVMSSIQEAGPGSTNIAVWYGIPIISTDTGFTSELLKENNVGIIVSTTNYEEWEKAFNNFFDGEKIKKLDREVLMREKGADINIKRLISFIEKVYNEFYN